ncbi:MAG: ankyrin repeat domain-containing protein [Gammaproteobacteria bacterium]|nr:ankyrin repeat domain-containing protein [Gammaproteobacteria bacterium]
MQLSEEEFQSKLNKLFNELLNNSEESALQALDKIVLSHSNLFRDHLLHIDMLANKVIFGGSLLFFATSKNYTDMVGKLIEYGHPIDEGTTCPQDIYYDKQSPLMIACEWGYIEIIKILLNNNANLLHTSSAGVSALMKVNSETVCKLLLTHAKSQKKLMELLSLTDNQGLVAHNYAVSRGDTETANLIYTEIYIYSCEIGNTSFIKALTIDDAKNIKDKNSLHRTRMGYFAYPEKSHDFDSACSILKKLPPQKNTIDFEPEYEQVSIEVACNRLFGNSVNLNKISSKDEAIKKAISQCYSLLESPLNCIKYLKFLNDEFLRYFKDKHNTDFDSLANDSYDYEIIDGTYFPIPNEKFIGIQQRHALQEFLILLCKKFGLGDNAFKWIGFIPNTIANKMIAEGDFITECTLGPGVFHNKMAHMIQRGILFYAINDGKITLEYTSEGKIHYLTFKDIAKGLVEFKDTANVPLWASVRDASSRKKIKFSDPSRLASVIMRDGKKLGIEALSDALIDTFCKGILKLLRAYNEHKEFAGMNLNTFIEKLNDLNLTAFDTPKHLIEKSLFFSGKKNEIIQSTHAYGIARKTYHPNYDFEPATFKI